jgi:predicted RNase H-like nuclease (RuvC/YqgF family)
LEYQSTVANLKKKLNNYDGTLIALSAHVHIPQAVQEALLSIDKATYSSGLVKLQKIVQDSLEQSAEAQQNYTQRESEKTIRELTDKLNTASTLHNDDINTLRTRLDNALLEVSTSKQEKFESANEVKQLQLKLELQNKEIASLNNEIEREKQLAQMQIQDVKERAETDIAHLKATLDAESSFQSSKLPDIPFFFFSYQYSNRAVTS